MFTHKALANWLLALSNQFYKPSVLTLALHNKTHYFSQDKVLLQAISIRTACRNAFSGHSDSWYLVSQICFHCKDLLYSIAGSTCDVFIRNTANRRKHYNAHSSTILHYFDSIFYYSTLMHSANFKNAVLGFSYIRVKQYGSSPYSILPSSVLQIYCHIAIYD